MSAEHIQPAPPELLPQVENLSRTQFLEAVYSRMVIDIVARDDFVSDALVEFGAQEVEDWGVETYSRERDYSYKVPAQLESGMIAQIGGLYVGIALAEQGSRNRRSGEVDRIQFGVTSVEGFRPANETTRRLAEIKARQLEGSNLPFEISPNPDPRPKTPADLVKIIDHSGYRDRPRVNIRSDGSGGLSFDSNNYVKNDFEGLKHRLTDAKWNLQQKDVELTTDILQTLLDHTIVNEAAWVRRKQNRLI